MIATTSQEVWETIVKPELTKRQKDVLFAAGQANDWVLNDLALYMGRFPNQISGRIGELIRAGKLEYLTLNGKILTRLPKSGGNPGKVFRIVRESIQSNLFN